MFAHELGIDVWEAIDAASTKPFGFMPFTPGTRRRRALPADRPELPVVAGAAHASATAFRFVDLANDVNDHMPDYVVQRIVLALNELQQSVNGARLLLLGLAYKKNTGDSRESPAMRVAELLHSLGASLRAVDPYVEPHRIPDYIDLCDLTPATVQTADAIVILTEHEGLDYPLIEAAPCFVLDTRRRLAGVRESI